MVEGLGAFGLGLYPYALKPLQPFLLCLTQNPFKLVGPNQTYKPDESSVPT